MNCPEFEELIAGYLDGTHNVSTRRAMKEHAASCPECARLLTVQAEIAAALDSAGPVRAPEGLMDRILAAAEREYVPSRGRSTAFWPAAAAILTFFLVTGGLSLLGQFVGAGQTDSGSGSLRGSIPEWPVFVKVWLAGIAGSAWIQKLMEPVYLPILVHAVPLCIVVAYGLFLGSLVWCVEYCFPPMPRMETMRLARAHRHHG